MICGDVPTRLNTARISWLCLYIELLSGNLVKLLTHDPTKIDPTQPDHPSLARDCGMADLSRHIQVNAASFAEWDWFLAALRFHFHGKNIQAMTRETAAESMN